MQVGRYGNAFALVYLELLQVIAVIADDDHRLLPLGFFILRHF